MLYYIAGPMRGYPLWNFPAFDAAAAAIRSKGHEVVSPAELDRAAGFTEHTTELPPNFMREAFRRDIAAIERCEGVAVLPGWQQSTGAKAEVAIAKWLGLPVVDAGTLEPVESSQTILEEAQSLVYGARHASYGHPKDDYERTVGAFNALTGHSLSVADGITFMLCVKLSRMQHSPENRDHYVDLAGYAACADRVRTGA